MASTTLVLLSSVWLVQWSTTGITIPVSRVIPECPVATAGKHCRSVLLHKESIQEHTEQHRASTHFLHHHSPGVHQVKVNVGTPPKTLRVMLDTGSSDFAVFTPSCSKCGKRVNGPWDASLSSTHKPFDCSPKNYKCRKCCAKHDRCCYRIKYVDGSGFTAHVSTDTMYFGDNKHLPFRALIGEIAASNGDWGNTDGIMGLSFPRTSAFNAKSTNPITQFVKAHDLPNTFSVCLQAHSGSLQMGHALVDSLEDGDDAHDSESAELSSEYTWIPLTAQGKKNAYWTVKMLDMRVFGKSVGIPHKLYNKGDAIVDTGTSALGFPWEAYLSLEELFFQNCGQPNGKLVGLCSGTAGEKKCSSCPKCPTCPTNTKKCPKCPKCEKCAPAVAKRCPKASCPRCPKCGTCKRCPKCPRCPKNIFRNWCFAMDEAQVAAYPPLQLVFEGTSQEEVVVDIPPEAYVQSGWCGKGFDHMYTLNLWPGNAKEGTYLSDSFFLGKTVFFDREGSRVGVKPSPACASTK
eukprot:TRINITY_DN68183_c5_g12_i1.p1 TRINITY_DN68183_c5_g12~~TRINITY_DN68183_c5_g12_i1.p1  ORF type:complete len:517 (-),score=29.48 TRINITY_DN68183_c5_g12_i1:157-1707(-)